MKRIFCHMVLLLLFSSNVFCQVEEGDYIIFTFSKKIIPHFRSRAQRKSWEHMSCSRFRMYNWIANVDSIKNNPQFVLYPLSISEGEEICFSDEQEDMSSVTDKDHAQKVAKSRESDIMDIIYQRGKIIQTIKSEWSNGKLEIVYVRATPIHGKFIQCDETEVYEVKEFVPSYILISDVVYKQSIVEDDTVKRCFSRRYNCLPFTKDKTEEDFVKISNY